MTADYAALVRDAQALRAAGRLDDAVERYREALAANPASGAAEHNLAGALGDTGRWAEAELHLHRAFVKGIDAPETWLRLARCHQALGRLDEADNAFREALKRRPAYHDAHRELAQLRWMRTGDASAMLTELDRAIGTYRGDINLAVIKVQALMSAEKPSDAFAFLARLADASPRDAFLAVMTSQVARAAGENAKALELAERGLAGAPREIGAQITLVEACLACGDPERAAKLAEDVGSLAPEDQHVIALKAIAWRMLSDPRYQRLYDYEAFVGTYQLDVPPGWPDLATYLADVAAGLKAIHLFRAQPFSQSLRHGGQATDILHSPHRALRALPQAMDGPIRRHLQKLGRGDDPVRSRNTGGHRNKGIWSVQLHAGGYHVNHVHPQGWLSSACYVETVKDAGHEGWLQFGEPGVKTPQKLAAEHFVKPEPGLLALFPSYMWHGTVPFTGDQKRLTFAFDLVPAPA
ncbi:MAG: putative 2OG-Fe(II) oxygenase [Hyphomonadaceae bacterium]|nr:putative 2OG-Fe(II) oxygenase [Hyphomonadaceae bacterium]